MADELHLHDYGTSLEFAITETDSTCSNVDPVDLTLNTGLSVRFKKTDGTILDVVGQIYTGGTNGDGTDGIVQYITQIGDIDQLGIWSAQVIVNFSGGKFASSIVKYIRVKGNL